MDVEGKHNGDHLIRYLHFVSIDTIHATHSILFTLYGKTKEEKKKKIRISYIHAGSMNFFFYFYTNFHNFFFAHKIDKTGNNLRK